MAYFYPDLGGHDETAARYAATLRPPTYQRASVQLSEKARAQVLNGLPSRWVGNGRPFA